MISWVYHRLPGPPAVRLLLFVLLAVVTLTLLVLFYEWLGTTFLDTGGQIP